MKKCLVCGNNLGKNDAFCPKCGTLHNASNAILTEPSTLSKLKIPLLATTAVAVTAAGAYAGIQARNKVTLDTPTVTASPTETQVSASATPSLSHSTTATPSPSPSASVSPSASASSEAASSVFKSKNSNITITLPEGIHAAESEKGTDGSFTIYFSHNEHPSKDNQEYYISLNTKANTVTDCGDEGTKVSYTVDDYHLLSNFSNDDSAPELNPTGGPLSPRVTLITWELNGKTYHAVNLSDNTAGPNSEMTVCDGMEASSTMTMMQQTHNGFHNIKGGVASAKLDGVITDSKQDPTAAFKEFSAIADGIKFN
ncbi:MAG: zinc ribbon domain-containing protein [Micrococcaceae bacterium]